MRRLFAIPLVLVAACGGSDSKALTSAGLAALGKGDAQTALSKFDTALAGMDRMDKNYVRAALGRCEALASLDGARATRSFLELAATVPEKVGEADFSRVCWALLKNGDRLHAMDVMKAGETRFPDSANMKATSTAVVAATQREGKPAELQKLDSFGYTGSSK